MRIDDLRDAVRSLEARMDQRFAAMDQRFAAIDQRFLGLEVRLDSMTKLMWGVLITVVTCTMATIGGIIASVVR